MTPEALVKAEIRQHLAALGIPYFAPVQFGFGVRGIDFYCTLPPEGRALLIEAKRPEGGKLSQFQKLTLKQNSAAGAICVVATCWADVLRAIDRRGSRAVSSGKRDNHL